MKAEMWAQQRLGVRIRRTWRDAVTRYCEEAKLNRSFDDAQAHLRWIDRDFGKLFLDEITRDRIDAVRARRQKDGVKPATVNRLLEIVRTILRRAEREWEWIDKAPHVRLLTVPRMRERFLSAEEAVGLLRELPEHLRAVAAFALETGLRMREILRLQWAHVELDKRRTFVISANAKNGHARAVPLSEIAAAIIGFEQGRHAVNVFTYQGKPVLQANGAAWRKALKRAGITDFRFHDLRHTWASWQAQAGTPLLVLQQLGGWQTAQMVQRYAHHQPGHLQPYAEKMSASVGLGSVLAQELRLSYAEGSTPR